MDKDIDKLYANSIGISFKWKHVKGEKRNKIQLVFKDTGMFLTKKQLLQFFNYINTAIYKSSKCGSCELNNKCKSILLETPVELLSFAVNYNELSLLKELVEGTFFEINLKNILKSRNISNN